MKDIFIDIVLGIVLNVFLFVALAAESIMDLIMGVAK